MAAIDSARFPLLSMFGMGQEDIRTTATLIRSAIRSNALSTRKPTSESPASIESPFQPADQLPDVESSAPDETNKVDSPSLAQQGIGHDLDQPASSPATIARASTSTDSNFINPLTAGGTADSPSSPTSLQSRVDFFQPDPAVGDPDKIEHVQLLPSLGSVNTETAVPYAIPAPAHSPSERSGDWSPADLVKGVMSQGAGHVSEFRPSSIRAGHIGSESTIGWSTNDTGTGLIRSSFPIPIIPLTARGEVEGIHESPPRNHSRPADEPPSRATASRIPDPLSSSQIGVTLDTILRLLGELLRTPRSYLHHPKRN